MGVVGTGKKAQGIAEDAVVVLAVNDVVHLAGDDHITGAVVKGPDGVTDANLVEGDW